LNLKKTKKQTPISTSSINGTNMVNSLEITQGMSPLCQFDLLCIYTFLNQQVLVNERKIH